MTRLVDMAPFAEVLGALVVLIVLCNGLILAGS
jgi:hypothetical protein